MDEKIKSTIIYAGERWNKKTHKREYFYVIRKNVSDVWDGTFRIFNKTLGAGTTPGAIFQATVEWREDGSISVFGDREFYGRYEDVERTKEWIALDWSAKAQATAWTRQKKMMGNNELGKNLDAIRNAYVKEDRAGRAAILASVIAYITGGATI